MKASQVTVERTKNGERISITINIEEGFTAEAAVASGRGFLAAQFGESPTEEQVAEAQRTIAASKYEKL
jgi:hypothetical protein